MPTVIVIASATNDPSDQDVGVEGHYEIQLPDDIEEAHLANAALDSFHSQVPVKNLDDFTFVVEDLEGNTLEPDDDVPEYHYAHVGEVDKV
jgi:hypothetical protein